MAKKWQASDIPDLSGKIAVVTGANGGLGIPTCRELAGKGAKVVMACRDVGRGEQAKEKVLQVHPNGKLDVLPLDLADISSIRRFAAQVQQDYHTVDILINNAGIIGMPLRRTKDGFELQMGVDCLGHFALTGLLFESLCRSRAARVVSVGTSSHPQKHGVINLDDLNWRHRRFHSIKATVQAKVAFQVCTFELQRRLAEHGIDRVQAMVAHPGIAETNVALAGADEAGAKISRFFLGVFNKVFTQSPDMGALPTLFAATSDQVKGGDYAGPGGPFEMWGRPALLKPGPIMRDEELADGLWQAAESLTGVAYLS